MLLCYVQIYDFSSFSEILSNVSDTFRTIIFMWVINLNALDYWIELCKMTIQPETWAALDW